MNLMIGIEPELYLRIIGTIGMIVCYFFGKHVGIDKGINGTLDYLEKMENRSKTDDL